jgi:hypothetical protein
MQALVMIFVLFATVLLGAITLSALSDPLGRAWAVIHPPHPIEVWKESRERRERREADRRRCTNCLLKLGLE